jgi:ArsR family transcriptional regulator
MVDRDYIYVPQGVAVDFDPMPAMNALESIHQLTMVKDKSGFSQWTHELAASLPADQLEEIDRLFTTLWPLFYGVVFPGPEYASFPEYIDALAALDPTEARDAVLAQWRAWHPTAFDAHPERILESPETVAAWAHAMMQHKDPDWADEAAACFAKSYDLLLNPADMLGRAVGMLRTLWTEHLEAEWRRVLPMLRESAAAHQRLSFEGMTALEALKKVTGRDLREAFSEKLGKVEAICFLPSAHIGPYVSVIEHEGTGYLIFGARLPREAQITSSDLSRAELVTRLSALADNTRLHILELLTTHDELCAQDIIEILNLSQSSVSRHLSQLSATGYITERRKDVAKCYSLNTERVVDILRALTSFLARKT